MICLIVCINYADLLEYSLSFNSKMFDHIYISTTADDIETLNVCKQYDNVEIILTDLIHSNNAVFNKGAIMKELQTHAHTKHPNEWILILDADIVIPQTLLEQISGQYDDTSFIYGLTRYEKHNKDNFNELWEGDSNFGKRLNEGNYPWGYFQLYYRKDVFYETSENCGECDNKFLKIFGKKKHMMKGFVIHLGARIKNWSGRVTDKWV